MNNLIARVNRKINRVPAIRPIKSWMADKVCRLAFNGLKLDKGKAFIQVHGLQRTGNHAIINWMMKGWDGTVVFCNNLDPGIHPKSAEVKHLKIGKGQSLILSSYEDRPMEDVPLTYQEKWYGVSAAHKHVLIIRDPFNLLASRYVWDFPQGERFRKVEAYRQEVIALWKEHARTYLQWKKDLRDNPASHYIPVNYNRWAFDEQYRMDLKPLLSLSQHNAGLQDVKDFGGGSSFEGTAQNRLSEHKFLYRFLNLVEEPAFTSLFQDQELLRLSQEIFGHIAKTELLKIP
ncbi:MAG: hypothetical protein AAF824_02360 [Bacteroidota bacterium]